MIRHIWIGAIVSKDWSRGRNSPLLPTNMGEGNMSGNKDRRRRL